MFWGDPLLVYSAENSEEMWGLVIYFGFNSLDDCRQYKKVRDLQQVIKITIK